MKIRKLPRRRLHRAFVRWLREFDEQFTHRLVIHRRTDRHIYWTFQGVTEAIQGDLNENEIWIAVNHQGINWDYLCNFDCQPLRGHDGYRCIFEHEDGNSLTDTRDEFWRRHLFEPLLGWVKEKLAPADSLELFGTKDGSTAATLIRHKTSSVQLADGVTIIPLHTDDSGKAKLTVIRCSLPSRGAR